MELLKLVIVDDEPILLQGLLETYDWESMGFQVVGSARDGEQAIQVIKEKKPNVVLTDIRMKKISGLQVMEEIGKQESNSLFVVLSAYRDFEYAKQACDLGAFAYLLKPINEEELRETMGSAYEFCIGQMENEDKLEKWENLIVKDKDDFLKGILQKYLKNKLSLEKVEKVFQTLDSNLNPNDKFIAVYTDVDLSYKITNSMNYEEKKYAMIQLLTSYIEELFLYWIFEGKEEASVFIIKAENSGSVIQVKQIFEKVKENEYPVVAAIAKPYKGIEGIKKGYDEAAKLFELACMSGASAFTMQEEFLEEEEKNPSEDHEILIITAIRKNDVKELKEAFIHFIYGLPQNEEEQMHDIHRMMLKTECMLRNTSGITKELQDQYQKYYSNIQRLTAGKAVDVCYKILCNVIEQRKISGCGNETKFFREYMSEAVAYIETHLNEEDLSIVSVANHVYLNSVYFGRIFKNTFHLSFKKYLMKRRMERAKKLLEEGNVSIGTICEQVGIGNSSYFSHLFKEYTGKLPSEYKREHHL